MPRPARSRARRNVAAPRAVIPRPSPAASGREASYETIGICHSLLGKPWILTAGAAARDGGVQAQADAVELLGGAQEGDGVGGELGADQRGERAGIGNALALEQPC